MQMKMTAIGRITLIFGIVALIGCVSSMEKATVKGDEEIPDVKVSNKNGEEGNGWDQNGATAACNRLGWSVGWKSPSSLICTKSGTSYNANCNKCTNWRLFVWNDGGTDQSTGGQTYGTKAGRSYGGHSPCKSAWNLPECTVHWGALDKVKCDCPTRKVCDRGYEVESDGVTINDVGCECEKLKCVKAADKTVQCNCHSRMVCEEGYKVESAGVTINDDGCKCEQLKCVKESDKEVQCNCHSRMVCEEGYKVESAGVTINDVGCECEQLKCVKESDKCHCLTHMECDEGYKVESDGVTINDVGCKCEQLKCVKESGIVGKTRQWLENKLNKVKEFLRKWG